MAQKRWQVKEFTHKTGLGLPQFRETVQRQVLKFLDKENLAPSDCCISWHTETNDRDGSETIVAQVFYRR